MKWTLKRKTWVFIILFTTITLLSIVTLTNYLYEQFYIDSQTEQLSARGDLLADVYYEGKGDKQEFHQLISFMSRCAAANIVYDSSDEFIGGKLPSTIPLKEEESQLNEDELEQLKLNNSITSTRDGLSREYLVIINPLFDSSESLTGAIVISTPVTAAFSPFESLKGLLFVVLLLGFIVIVFVLKKVADYVINPVEKITAASKEVAKGDFSEKIQVSNKDEIGDLAASFNSMSTALAETEQKKQEFLGNVSHELRTPLSYVRGYSEVLLEQMTNGEALVVKHIEKIQSESLRMESLIHDLLDLARLEGDTYPMTYAPIPFAQLIEEVVERTTLLCGEHHINIRTELDYSCIIKGDEKRLEQVVINLVENAIRYGCAGKYIDLKMTMDGDKAILKVIDYGEGLPKEDLKQLTERFYRKDRSRSRSSGGTGLGLTIVKEIIKKHEGTLSFDSSPGEGMTVTVKLPLFEE